MRTTLKMTCAALLMLRLAQAQPTITNAGNFSIGTVLKFQPCNPTTGFAGASGSNMVWNFSNLEQLQDTLKTTIVNPASTTSGSMYPTATLAERNSDRTTNYIQQTQGKSYVVGFIDSTASYPIRMTSQNPMLVQQNPVTFGTSVTDTFAVSYTLQATGYVLRGKGTSRIEGDAYGTLILPNHTYNNVLRVKLTIHEQDSIVQTNSSYITDVVSYQYFDGSTASTLLQIDSTHSNGPVIKKIKFLLSDNTTPLGIRQQRAPVSLNCYPNPSQGIVSLQADATGTLDVRNAMGQTVRILAIERGSNTLHLGDLPTGVYAIELKTATGVSAGKLILY